MTDLCRIIRWRGLRIMVVQPSCLRQIIDCWCDTHVMLSDDVDGYACRCADGCWEVAEAQTGECYCEDFRSFGAVMDYLAGGDPDDIRAHDRHQVTIEARA